MTVESETNEPNQSGFAGAASGPEPVKVTENLDDINAESIAVPGGDLTEALSEAMEPAAERDAEKHGD